MHACIACKSCMSQQWQWLKKDQRPVCRVETPGAAQVDKITSPPRDIQRFKVQLLCVVFGTRVKVLNYSDCYNRNEMKSPTKAMFCWIHSSRYYTLPHIDVEIYILETNIVWPCFFQRSTTPHKRWTCFLGYKIVFLFPLGQHPEFVRERRACLRVRKP